MSIGKSYFCVSLLLTLNILLCEICICFHLVKGVNFFGPRSEYIVSGSDCSNIFIWDKNTEEVVTYFQGDGTGVVSNI